MRSHEYNYGESSQKDTVSFGRSSQEVRGRVHKFPNFSSVTEYYIAFGKYYVCLESQCGFDLLAGFREVWFDLGEISVMRLCNSIFRAQC